MKEDKETTYLEDKGKYTSKEYTYLCLRNRLSDSYLIKHATPY